MKPPGSATVPFGELVDDVARGFAGGGGDRRLRVGVEVELIPVRADEARRVPITAQDGEGISGVGLVELAGQGQGWRPGRTAMEAPAFAVPGMGAITFEPGGQLEVSTRTFTHPDELLTRVLEVLRRLYGAADRLGIRLIARGVDPLGSPEGSTLFLTSERYRKQARHYDRSGPWGRCMMSQSAAVHVNLDFGGRALRRWWVANRMAPFLTALFANSARHAGADTGSRSVRAEWWRRLDRTRTGLLGATADAVAEYTSFALAALDFLGPDEGAEPVPFRSSWEAGAPAESWRRHLTTLFPEVRPRGYLELRSVDAQRPAWIAAPVLLATAVLYDPEALAEAGDLLPAGDADTLRAAGRAGMRDPGVRSMAIQLVDLAIEGARRLEREVQTGACLEVLAAFRSRFVGRGADPGEEADDLDPFVI